MGGAQSSNVAQATSEIANKVSDTTSVNTTQLNNQNQQISLWQCMIKLSEDFNFRAVATADLRNKQITHVNSNTNFNNSVQQSVIQEAISKVGSMGVGYAQATNNTSIFCSISNEILKTVNQSASQFNSSSQRLNCDGSTIIARNLNVHFSSSAEFFNDQLLHNTSVNNVTNDITQSVTQKASATVQGLAGFLIGIALIIAALGYGVAKPLSSGSTKIIVVFVLSLVLFGIGISMYIAKAPPFFNDPLKVAVHSNMVPAGCDSIVDPKLEDVHIDKAPLRYQFALTKNNTNAGGIIQKVNLVSLATIASSGSGANNSGYTMTALNTIETVLKALNPILSQLKSQTTDTNMQTILGITIPNLLVNPIRSKMIAIPPQFILSSGSGKSGDKTGEYTPGTFVWNPEKYCDLPQNWTHAPPSEGCSWSLTESDYTNDPWFGVANENTTEINSWINNVTNVNKDKGSAFIRFILLFILNQSMSAKIDLNVYQEDWELVYYPDPKTNQWTINFGKNAPQDVVHKFRQNSVPDFANGTDSGGTVRLLLGICNNREYRFKQWVGKIGQWILLGIISLMVLFVVIITIKAKKSQTK